MLFEVINGCRGGKMKNKTEGSGVYYWDDDYDWDPKDPDDN
jgi:hypothetical protein